MITPSFVASLSKVRPDRLIETSLGFERFKQRQVDVLTKSSLELPINCTVVYIHKGSRDHKQNIEADRIMRNRSEANRM